MKSNHTSKRVRLLSWLMAMVLLCSSIQVPAFAEEISFEDEVSVEQQSAQENAAEEIDDFSEDTWKEEEGTEGDAVSDLTDDEAIFDDLFEEEGVSSDQDTALEGTEEVVSEEEGEADASWDTIILEEDSENLFEEDAVLGAVSDENKAPHYVVTSNVAWAEVETSTESPYLFTQWFDSEPEDPDNDWGEIDSDFIIKNSTDETFVISNYDKIKDTCPLEYVEIAGLKIYLSDFVKCTTYTKYEYDTNAYPGLFGKTLQIVLDINGIGIYLSDTAKEITSDISLKFVFQTEESTNTLTVKEGTDYAVYAVDYIRSQEDGSNLYGVYARPKNGYQFSSYTLNGQDVTLNLTEDNYVRYRKTENDVLKYCNYFEIAIQEDTEITLNCTEAVMELKLHSYNPVNAGDYISKYLWYITGLTDSYKKQFAQHDTPIPLIKDGGAKFWYTFEIKGFLEISNSDVKNSLKIYSGTKETENSLIFDSNDPDAMFSFDHADPIEEDVVTLSDIVQEDSELAFYGREMVGGYAVLSKCPELEKITLVIDYAGYHFVETADVQMADALPEVKEYTAYYTENYGLDKFGLEAYTTEEKQTEGYKKYCQYSNFRYVMRKVYQSYITAIASAKEEDRKALLNTAKAALDAAAKGENCNAVVWSFKDSLPVIVAIPNDRSISASVSIEAALEALYPGNWSYNYTLTQFGAFVNSITAGGAEDTGCVHAKQSTDTGSSYGFWFYNGEFSDWGVSNYYPFDGDVMWWGTGNVDKNWNWALLRLKYGDTGLDSELVKRGTDKTIQQLTASELKALFPEVDFSRNGQFRDITAAELVEIKIGRIGTVTPDSGDVIKAARDAYKALTEEQQAEVKNYQTLLDAEAAFAELTKKADVAYTDALSTVLNSMNNGTILGVGSQNGEWAILSLARYGIISGKDSSGQAAEYQKAVKTAIADGTLTKSTDYARVTLALTALGVEAPSELISQCENYDKAVNQGINAVAYALMALDSRPYDKTNTAIRDKYISYMTSHSCNAGGWVLGDDPSAAADADVTAMVIQALAPYYRSRSDVKAAVDKGLEALKTMQKVTGGFASYNTYNAESTAQVIVALTSLGIDPTTWNGHDAVDALLHFYSNGKFSHTLGADADQMATEQATYALTAYWRLQAGKSSLYRMYDAFGDITVTFALYGDELHSVTKDGDLHTYRFFADEMDLWIPVTEVTVAENATVGDVFKEVLDANGFTYVGLNNNYISKITNKDITLAEFDNTNKSGWMYLVNGSHPDVGLNAKKLQNGDAIIWHWTDDYRLESGSEMYNSGRVTSYVENLIKEIGTVEGTQECKKAIEQARAVYDKLGATEKGKITNYETLTKAEDIVSASDWCWHEYDAGKVTTEATCTKKGVKTYTCKHCTHTRTEEISAKGHTAGAWTETKAATCKNTGTKVQKCSVCGETIRTETIPVSVKHTYGSWSKVSEATVSAKEIQKHTCSVCGKTETQQVGSKLTPVLEVPGKLTSLSIKKGKTVKFSVSMAKGDAITSVKADKTKYLSTAVDKKSGKITLKGKKTGTVKLTITLASKKTRTYTVKITGGTVKTTGLSVTNVSKNALTLNAGKTYTLTSEVKPFTSTQKVTYKTSNKKVATVTSSGKIKAVGAGKATITVTSGSKKVKVTVTVPGIANLKSSVTVKKNKTTTLKPKTYGISEKVTYTSSNPQVAAVTAAGKVKGLKKGTAKITVKAGNYTKTVTVKVK